MDVRVCRNGHTTPLLYRKGDGRVFCIECQRARSRKYVMPPEVRERKRAYDVQYGREKRAGWR